MSDKIDERSADLAELLANLSGLILNERVESYNEGVDAERERCAKIAEPWSGFMTGDKMGAMDQEIVKVRSEIAAAIRFPQ
jgi:hypothetical protein